MSLTTPTTSTTSSTSTSAASPARTTAWQLDPSHSTAQFGVRHMMISTVRGTFDKVSGTVALDEADPTRSVIDVQIDATSINSREAKRDAHLRSADFFDVENHPTIRFHSTRIQTSKNAGHYSVTGDLTIRGITKPVTLEVAGPSAPQVAPWGAVARGVSATGKVSRKEWGLNWNAAIEAGGFVVGDEVELHFEAELVPATGVQ